MSLSLYSDKLNRVEYFTSKCRAIYPNWSFILGWKCKWLLYMIWNKVSLFLDIGLTWKLTYPFLRVLKSYKKGFWFNVPSKTKAENCGLFNSDFSFEIFLSNSKNYSFFTDKFMPLLKISPSEICHLF